MSGSDAFLTCLHLSDPFTNAFHNPSAFMSQDHWETPLRISSTQGIGIGVANGGGDYLPGRQEKNYLSVHMQLQIAHFVNF